MHSDEWLHENGFHSEERLNLVSDADWRELLQMSCSEETFMVFKRSISAFRRIPFDGLHT